MADYALDFEVIATGAKTANSIDPTNFTNTAGSNNVSGNWLLAGTRRNFVPTVGGLALRTVASSRDIEVIAWTRRGTITLREAASRALYLFHNGEAGGGTVEIGIVYGTGYLTSGSGPGDGWTVNVLWTTTNATSTIAGYSTSNTAGQTFTFGCEGVDVYAKLNGVEFIRFKEFRHVASGKSAVYCVQDYGVRSMSVDHLADAALFSDFSTPSVPIIDPRDFGMKQFRARGAIAAGSTLLTLDRNPGFAVGDQIIVAAGGSASNGVRGTEGPGGSWPALAYASAAARVADTSKPANTYCWQRDTGDVYRYVSSAWVQQNGFYYWAKVCPKALRATITNVSGTTLTLGTAATAAITGAWVYSDNAGVLHKLVGCDPAADCFRTLTYNGSEQRNLVNTTPAVATVRIPAGWYAVGEIVIMRAHPGWTFEGTSKEASTLFAPYGCPSGALSVTQSANAVVRRLSLRGNKTDVRYGYWYWSFHPDFQASLVTETNIPSDTGYPAVVSASASTGLAISDFAIYEPFKQGIALAINNAVVSDGLISQQYHQLEYLQWLLQLADSSGCTLRDVHVYSKKLVAGIEPFSSVNILFERVSGHNAAFSANNANGEYRDCSLLVDADALVGAPAFSINNPLVNVNSNTGNTLSTSFLLTNFNITISGYLNANKDILAGIVVQADNENVTINGGSYTAPDYSAPSAIVGPQGVRSVGPNTIVDGFTVWGNIAGTPGLHNANIGIDSGQIKNCVANTIYGTAGQVTLTNNTGH